MGGGMKLEKELVSGLSWWAVVQDTALQALSFPSRVTIPPCHPPTLPPRAPTHHAHLWCIVHHHQNNGMGLGAIIPHTDHQKVHQQTTLWFELWGEVASMCGGMDWALPLPSH